MTELDHDPLLQKILQLEADLKELREQESATPKTGVWTPSFVGTGTAGVFTYSNQIGTYALIGKLVYIYGRCTITAIGTPPAGNMTIAGLPFTSEATNLHPIYFGFISQFNYTAGALDLSALVNNAATTIQLRESFDNAAAVQVPAANFTNAAADLIFSGWYKIA